MIRDSQQQPPLVKYRPLPRRFFARNTLEVARELLGHLLVHETSRGRLVGRIVEVEAYRGPRDPASHAFRRTSRSEFMWNQPGTAYVYFTYGNHYCANVVTEPEGTAGAVLLRAVEPLEGIDAMRARSFDPRSGRRPRASRDAASRVASGPGRLTKAMGIGPQHNGVDLTRPPLYIARGRARPMPVATSPRIGIRAATARPWRFYVAGNAFVSR